MRWMASPILVLGLLAVSAACATPSLPADGGALYLTSELVEDGLVISDDTYSMGPDAGPVGGVPMGAGLVYYSYDIRFDHVTASNFTYVGPVTSLLPLRCMAAWAGLYSFTAYLYVIPVDSATTFPQSVAAGTVFMPTTCTNGQVMDLSIPWNLTLLSLRAGDTVRLMLSSPIGHPGPVPVLEVVTGDAAHPAGLFGNWTADPVFVAWQDTHAFDQCCSYQALDRLFTTGADGVEVYVNGTIRGSSSSYYLQVTVTDIVTGDQVLGQRFEVGGSGRRDIGYQAVLNTGGDARWSIDVRASAEDGSHYSVEFTPVVFEVTSKVEEPTVVEGAGNETTPPTPTDPGNETVEGGPGSGDKGSPVALAVPLAGIGLAVWARRRQE